MILMTIALGFYTQQVSRFVLCRALIVPICDSYPLIYVKSMPGFVVGGMPIDKACRTAVLPMAFGSPMLQKEGIKSTASDGQNRLVNYSRIIVPNPDSNSMNWILLDFFFNRIRIFPVRNSFYILEHYVRE